ncbi:MAG: SH3 domain-containing protein, partial [Bdellovibrio sp.]
MFFSFFLALSGLVMAQTSSSLNPDDGRDPTLLRVSGASGKIQRESEQNQESQAREAVVVAPRARVYLKPDFDSPVLRTLPRKTRIRMSNRLFGAFYRVRLSDGSLGFMTDVDIQALISEKDSKTAISKAPVRSLFHRFWGLAMAWIDFQEESMERRNRGSLQAFGLKFVGADLLGPGSYPM